MPNYDGWENGQGVYILIPFLGWILPYLIFLDVMKWFKWNQAFKTFDALVFTLLSYCAPFYVFLA